MYMTVAPVRQIDDVMWESLLQMRLTVFMALFRETVPKAFLTSVAVKTQFGWILDRAMMVFTIVSAPAGFDTPCWYGASALQMSGLASSSTAPVASLSNASKSTTGLTASRSFGLESGLHMQQLKTLMIGGGQLPLCHMWVQSSRARTPVAEVRQD